MGGNICNSLHDIIVCVNDKTDKQEKLPVHLNVTSQWNCKDNVTSQWICKVNVK